MYIGIIDQDALLYKKNFFPNLEVMKISSYHKAKRDIVDFILNMTILDKYSKIYLRKNIQDNYYPSFVISKDNCDYGGLSFTNNQYIPMTEEIENTVPDFSIYNNYMKIIKPKCSYGLKEEELSKAIYTRAYYNDIFKEDIFLAPLKANTSGLGSIFIYDKDFFRNIDCLNILKNNMKEDKKRIKFLYPQRLSNYNLISEICKAEKIFGRTRKDTSFFVYTKQLYKKDFLEVCAQADKDFKSSISFEIGADKYKTYTDNFLKEEFITYLNRIIYVIAKGVKHIKFSVNPEILNKDYKALYGDLAKWYNSHFTKMSFCEFVKQNNSPNKEIFKKLVNSNNMIRELSLVKPREFLSKGGDWIL